MIIIVIEYLITVDKLWMCKIGLDGSLKIKTGPNFLWIHEWSKHAEPFKIFIPVQCIHYNIGITG